MGKQSKQTEAEQRRQYLANLRRQEEEKQKRQQRLMWQIVIAAVALILIVVVVTVAIVIGSRRGDGDGTGTGTGTETQTTKHDPNHVAPAMEELDFSSVALENTTETDTVTDYVKLNISYTDKYGTYQTGNVIVRLFESVAPKTVANFKSLVAEDFYTGLSFHRIIEGFMIQGGAPKGSDTVPSIVGEFESNGFENNLLHNRGVISMARTNDPDSASSQFFIMHDKAEHLDGDYAAFGYVVYGMSTVDGIATTPVNDSDYPMRSVTINYATFVTVAE